MFLQNMHFCVLFFGFKANHNIYALGQDHPKQCHNVMLFLNIYLLSIENSKAFILLPVLTRTFPSRLKRKRKGEVPLLSQSGFATLSNLDDDDDDDFDMPPVTRGTQMSHRY